MRKVESFHQLCCLERIISKNKEKSVYRRFILVTILVGFLIAILVGRASKNRNLIHAVFDDFKHQFHKIYAVRLLIRNAMCTGKNNRSIAFAFKIPYNMDK